MGVQRNIQCMYAQKCTHLQRTRPSASKTHQAPEGKSTLLVMSDLVYIILILMIQCNDVIHKVLKAVHKYPNISYFLVSDIFLVMDLFLFLIDKNKDLRYFKCCIFSFLCKTERRKYESGYQKTKKTFLDIQRQQNTAWNAAMLKLAVHC